MKIRTAIFGVYGLASVAGFAALMAFALRDVRLRYIEAMRRTMGDTAVFLAAYAGEGPSGGEAWARRLAALPPQVDLLRVFACDPAGRVLFDSAGGRDVGRFYEWTMTGGGRAASENYTARNVALVGDELRVAALVRVGGAIVGSAGVARPIATVAEGVSHARGRLVAAGLGIAGVMLVAGWWIAARLTRSLERLAAYALAVRDGKNATPPASRATEIAALGAAFEEMRAALEGKEHVERYTQALAHELKAPLSAIRGAAEILGENPPEPERARFLSNLRAEAERIRRIVDRLLALAALEARRGRVERAPLDLRVLAAEVCAEARALAEARRLTLTATGGEPVWVRGERDLLVQALGGLVHNALEFSPPGAEVRVSVTAEDARAIASVEDSGPGVPDYALEKIFDKFYSLPRPDTGRKSSGLGLALAREAARLHGGDVVLANRPGGGARAELSLPAA